MPPFDVMASLAETAGVDLHWLATGLGNPERASDHAAAGNIEDAVGNYSLYTVSPRADRDKIASLILLVEQRIADALPQHMKARMAADLIIQYLEGKNDESK